jgi:arylsulfatase A-like enzyme
MIKPGTTSDHISAFWDMLPTFCELAKVDTPEDTDGISILSALRGKTQKKHDYLYWEFTERGGKQALRRGDFKAVRLNVTGNPEAEIELYNLASDPGETKNIATRYPETVQEMGALFKKARTKSGTFPLFKT